MNVRDSLREKLFQKFRPYHHPQMSQVFAAIVGFVLDEYIVSPRMATLTVSPDGFLLAWAEGEVSPVAVGHHEELVRSWSALLRATKLTTVERIEADSLRRESWLLRSDDRLRSEHGRANQKGCDLCESLH
jgi:hypothetical protein